VATTDPASKEEELGDFEHIKTNDDGREETTRFLRQL